MTFKRRPSQIILILVMSLSYLASPAMKAASPRVKPYRGGNLSGLALNTSTEPKLDQLEMIDLFNGKDLTGWSVKGGQMLFQVMDGILVGKCDPSVRLNSFLATDNAYTDFILSAEYQWVVPSNSGIMIRAATRPLQPNEKTKIKDRTLHRVFGLQCEIDSSSRGWTGGIYGEAMGGWKYPLSKDPEHNQAREAVKDQLDWNRITIHVEGDKIKTWVNGIPCANLSNRERQSGFIALQVHQGKQGEINWRAIRIKELNKS